MVAASTADGFGMMAGSAQCIALALGLAQGPDSILRGCRPWALSAAWSAYEAFLMMRSQRPAPDKVLLLSSGWKNDRPMFVGYDGKTLVKKLHYPFRVNFVRSAVIFTSISLCAVHLIKQKEYVAALVMCLTTVIGFATYMTNGYDNDFTCARVWIWHGCIGVFAYIEATCCTRFEVLNVE